MVGALGYGASNIPEPRPVTRAVSNISMNDRSKVPDRQNVSSESSTKQASSRSEGLSIRRVQHGKKTFKACTSQRDGTNSMPMAGEPTHPQNLTDTSNTCNVTGLPNSSSVHSKRSLQPASDGHHEKSSVTPAPPTTPINSHSAAQYYSTPNNVDRYRSRAESTSHSHHDQHLTTPSNKDKSHFKNETADTPTAASSSGGLYRSGKENSTSGMSTVTSGSGRLGREIPGMSAALERRHARIDHRLTAND